MMSKKEKIKYIGETLFDTNFTFSIIAQVIIEMRALSDWSRVVSYLDIITRCELIIIILKH